MDNTELAAIFRWSYELTIGYIIAPLLVEINKKIRKGLTAVLIWSKL
jgi:hypothetical protein